MNESVAADTDCLRTKAATQLAAVTLPKLLNDSVTDSSSVTTHFRAGETILRSPCPG